MGIQTVQSPFDHLHPITKITQRPFDRRQALAVVAHHCNLVTQGPRDHVEANHLLVKFVPDVVELVPARFNFLPWFSCVCLILPRSSMITVSSSSNRCTLRASCATFCSTVLSLTATAPRILA